MTVHIEGVRIAIFVVGCLVGYFVFKHSMSTHPGLSPRPADVGGAIIVACTVMTVLMLLFGDANGDARSDDKVPDIQPTSLITEDAPLAEMYSPAPPRTGSD